MDLSIHVTQEMKTRGHAIVIGWHSMLQLISKSQKLGYVFHKTREILDPIVPDEKPSIYGFRGGEILS